MSSPEGQPLDEERLRLRRCLDGDPAAFAQLRETHDGPLRSVLMARGATGAEIDDLLADLWKDCLPGNEERGSLLDRHNGRGSTRAWLATILTHRFMDLKRREQLRARYVEREKAVVDATHTESAGFLPLSETELTGLLRNSLQTAFGACPAEALVMLRLVHLHGVTQREIGRMWRWHESKVSRALSTTLADICNHTLSQIRMQDPWLDLQWEDLLEVCANTPGGILPE